MHCLIIKWLIHDAPKLTKPWAAFVSWGYPHFPFIVPQEFFDLYEVEDMLLPIGGSPDQWDAHPRSVAVRRGLRLDKPLSEAQLRLVTAAYYGMVSFVDYQVGQVLQALEKSGQAENTIVIYTSDHGEMLGEHGHFYKSLMYERRPVPAHLHRHR